MATFNKFSSFVADLANKVHNLGTDQLTVALSNTAPVATNAVLADITQISYTGFSSRVITTTSSTQAAGLYKLIVADLTLTASATTALFRYIIIYNSTAAAGNLIGFYDYASSTNLPNAGDTFIVDFDQVNGLIQLT